MRYAALGNDKGIYIISQLSKAKLYRILREQNISREAYRKERDFMDSKTIKELSVELIVEITAICDNIKGRSVFINQLLRSCSSIGANSHEVKYAQSNADFISKLEIALKECYETEYWLEVLFKVNALNELEYKSLLNKCGTIRRKLISSITTVKNKI